MTLPNSSAPEAFTAGSIERVKIAAWSQYSVPFASSKASSSEE